MKKKNLYCIATDHWYIERMIYLVGGALVALSALLALFVSEKWLYFTIFVGVMFMNFALSGYCPMALILDKLGVKRK